MNIRKFAAAAVLLASLGAGDVWAQLSAQYQDWDETAVKFLLTKDEEAAWKRVKTDAEAEKFIALFWARRDPTPQTPVNEFRDEFDARVKLADERFTAGRLSGSVTDRGKVLVLLGPPTRIARSGAAPNPNIQTPGGTSDDQGNLRQDRTPTEVWYWETQPETAELITRCAQGTMDLDCRTTAAMRRPGPPPFLGLREMEVSFVDQNSSNQWRLGRSPKFNVNDAMKKAAAFYLVAPGLTELPTYQTQVAAVPAEETQPATSFQSPALQAAFEQFKAQKESPYRNVHVSYGQYVTADGRYFVPVQLYMPASDAVTADAEMAFFGVIEDASGKVVAVYEEPIKVAASKSDVYVDRSLELEPGEYQGTFGLAVDDKPVTIGRTRMALTPIASGEEGISQLLLSNNIFPMSEAQRPTEPFAFGGIKVVPKGDRTFKQADELWYFFELRNPGLNPPADPAAEGAVGTPKIQVAIDVTGQIDGKPKRFRLPLTEVQAQELKGVPGHYAVGSAIPLAGFQPGEYTMEMKVLDTVTKKSFNLKETFKVVP